APALCRVGAAPSLLRALSLHDALPIFSAGFGVFHLGTMQQLSQHPDTLVLGHRGFSGGGVENTIEGLEAAAQVKADLVEIDVMQDRKSTRLNSSHVKISYAVFCLKKNT